MQIIFLLPITNTTHFEGEFKTLHTSLKQLFSHIQPFRKVVVLSEAKATIQSVTHTPANTRTIEIHHSVRLLQGLHKEIVL